MATGVHSFAGALAASRSSLVADTGARYRPVTSVLLHALTSGFFTLAAWCGAGSLILAAVALLSGPYRWAAAIRRYFRFTGS